MSSKDYTPEEQMQMQHLRDTLIPDGKVCECHYCGQEGQQVKHHRGGDTDYSIDHIVPVKEGGECLESNVVVSCWSCNNARGHMDYQRFYDALEPVRIARARAKRIGLSQKDIKNGLYPATIKKVTGKEPPMSQRMREKQEKRVRSYYR